MRTRTLAGIAVGVMLAIGASVVPAHATVHEIVAQWCSGQEPLEPHGISRPGSKNFAKPLNAIGVVIMIVNEDKMEILVTFDYDHPAVKVKSTGMTLPIGETLDGFTILLDLIEPDPDFPAFQHCPALAG